MSSAGSKKILIITAIVLIAAIVGGTAYYLNVTANANRRLIIATTTSTVDTGLLNYLKPYFDNKFNANMTWLSLGTGQAIEVAARGDADVLLVHDRVREDAFVASGNGTMRATIMYNDYIIIGPPNDPAGAAGANATLSMQKIRDAGLTDNSTFVSRGDGSGTNALEKRLWTKAGITGYANASWYYSTGSGMAATIRVANEKAGYTITDRASFYSLNSTMALSLVIITEYDGALLNPYGILQLNSTRYTNIQSDLGTSFLLFICSNEGQALIANYTINGRQLFFPMFGNPESIGLPSENSTVTVINNMLKARGIQ
jgi:tungstate transport system substrate-binding protein